MSVLYISQNNSNYSINVSKIIISLF